MMPTRLMRFRTGRSRPSGFGPRQSWDRLTLLHWHTVDKASLSYHDVRMAADMYDDCILLS